jgi:hypothetical protein
MALGARKLPDAQTTMSSMKFEPLELPEPSPATPFVVLELHESGDSYVEYDAWGGKERIRLRFKRCIAGRLGDFTEAGFAPKSIGIIVDSEWLARHVAAQRASYPNDPNTLVGIRHFFIKGHDAIAEVLAETFTVESAGREVARVTEIVHLP